MKITYIVLLSLFILVSCKSNTNQSETNSHIAKKETFENAADQTRIPQCVLEKIEAIKNGQVRNPPTVAQELMLYGKSYYLIPSGCCDQFDYIIDDKCKTFCSQGYGVRGKFNNGCDTLKNATRKVIWRDTRKY